MTNRTEQVLRDEGIAIMRRQIGVRTVLVFTALVFASYFGFISPAGCTRYPDSQASAHVGQAVTIVGTVTGTHVTAKGTEFLNFGARYPAQDFTVVIFASSAAKVGDIGRYYGKRVAVTGRVQLYQGKPEIVVNSSTQLEVMR